MNRARTFPPSPAFSALAVALSSQLADFEEAGDSDGAGQPFFEKWSETEKTLTRMPVETTGDLLLKIEVLAQIAEHSEIDHDEWKALGRDAERLNGPGMAFVPEAWLRRWTNRGGGYVRTDSGVSFVAPEPPTVQQRFMLDELQRADGHQAVADVIDRPVKPQPTEPTISEMWERAKAAYEEAQATLDQAPSNQSDEACEAEVAAWDAMMMAPAPDLDGVRHKFAELFWILFRDHYEPEESWSERFVTGVINDIARITREGGAS